MTWNQKTSRDRIQKAIEDCSDIKVTNYRVNTDLDSLALTRAVRVDGVHVYADIVNADELLSSDTTETERCHKRYLRFLHIFQRVTRDVLAKTSAIKVAVHNQRLHFVVADPVGDVDERLDVAVAIAQLLIDVIEAGNELHADLADAKLAIGIDSGKTLAVKNGTRGDRELLFLGNAANKAAHAVPSTSGIRAAETAKSLLGWAKSKPTADEIATCQANAKLGIDPKALVKKWKAELAETPLQEFQFSRPTPPLKDLDFETLTPANSRRIECASIYADIDGYTAYVTARIDDDTKAAQAVCALHVIRKELRDTLNDLGGKKVRYIGDCLHGVIARGDRETDLPGTVTDALLAAGAMRDAFAIAKDELEDVAGLGLAIGVEVGPTALTRLGVKHVRDRIAAGTAVRTAETAQCACSGRETGLGETGYAKATKAVQKLFDGDRRAKDLSYNTVFITVEADEKRSAARPNPPTSAPTLAAPNPPPVVEYPRAHSKRS